MNCTSTGIAADQSGNWRRFGKLPEPVMRHPDLTDGEKVTYASVAMHCGNSTAKVGQRKLAVATGRDVRTVQRHLKKMQALGLIRISPGNGKAKVYSLPTPDTPVATAPDTAVASPTTRMSADLRHGRRGDPNRVIKEPEKRTANERFRDAYKRKS